MFKRLSDSSLYHVCRLFRHSCQVHALDIVKCKMTRRASVQFRFFTCNHILSTSRECATGCKDTCSRRRGPRYTHRCFNLSTRVKLNLHRYHLLHKIPFTLSSSILAIKWNLLISADTFRRWF